MKSRDPIKVVAFEHLFKCANRLVELSSTPNSPHRLFYAKGIIVKILRQISSACLLLDPVPVPNHDLTISDPSSVAVISRSILESYLIWERIYIIPETDSEREYWYFAWALKTYYLRTSLPPPVPNALVDVQDPLTGQNVKVPASNSMQNMNDRVIELQEALKENNYCKSMIQRANSKKRKRINEQITKGWKASPSELLNNSLRLFHSTDMYSYLCAIAHLDHLEVKQLILSPDHQSKIAFAETPLTVVLVVLARICEQYPEVFPETKEIRDQDQNTQEWIKAYREVLDRHTNQVRLRPR